MIDDDRLRDGKEARIFGPPGTGKTTYLSKQVTTAVKKFGSLGVLVTSYTRAAAVELVSRQLPIPKERIGTLHFHCFHALGRPKMTEKELDLWNREHAGYRLSSNGATVDEMALEGRKGTLGDELYAQQEVLRARMIPPDQWPGPVRRFFDTWSAWKAANGLMDFSDLLEIARRDFKFAPGNPDVILVDEAQDHSRLQLNLLRQWGRHAECLVMAGDDDQTLYHFAGADPEALLEQHVPPFCRRVLEQSYRVPRAIHAVSQEWIRRVEVREPKEYFPRDADGEVRILTTGNYKCPERVLDDAERYLADGKSVMFLATCSYMLNPLKAVLGTRGMPFHNPYRSKRSDWNPLLPAGHDCSGVDRLLAFLRARPELNGQCWTGADLRAWIMWLRSEGLLLQDADALIKWLPNTNVTDYTLACLFQPEPLKDLLRRRTNAPLAEYVAWWRSRLAAKKRRLGRYLADVAVRHGIEALTARPRVIIGTGHSVKGGEAHVVYMFPDLSEAGMRQWEGPRRERDRLIRLGYVMMTRARESLVICSPATSNHMPVEAMVRRMQVRQ